jgi:hypothetical protein
VGGWVDGWLISRPAGSVPDATGWPGQQGKEPNIQSFLGHKESDGGEGTEADERERERDLEREERWRDLGGSVCLPPVSLLLLLLYLCHNFSETHLVSFGGVLLFFGWFFFLFRFGICLLSQEVICLSPFRGVPNWVAAPIARCSGQIGV